MARRRRKQEGLFFADSLGGNSFRLDGTDYTNTANTTAGPIAVGEGVTVGPTKGRRRQMVILGRASERTQLSYNPFLIGGGGITVNVIAWLQSNQGPGQNAVGGRVNPALLVPNGSSTYWTLPTSTETGVTHTGLRAFGLARAQVPVRNWESGDLAAGSETLDCYLTAWPRQDESGNVGVTLGAWRVSDRVNLWLEQNSSMSGWTNPAYPLRARFFVDSLSGFAHAVDRTTDSSPGRITSAAARYKGHESFISRAATGGLNLANLSLHSFLVTVGEGEEATTEIQSYFFCPAHPRTAATGEASVDFLVMDQTSGEWGSISSRDVSDLPEGGYAAIPDVVSYGSETGGPPAWRGSEALAFCTGGQQDPLSELWSKIHWAIRSLKPVDGTDGDLLVSFTEEPVANPTELSQASLKTQIAGVDHPLEWIDSFPWNSGFWVGGLRIDSTTSKSEWANYTDPPILLPYESPNTGRLGTLASRLTSEWPPVKKNCGGGMVVDQDADGGEHIAFCVLVPEQFVYAKGYAEHPTPSIEDPDLVEVTDALQTYKWRFVELNACTGFNTDVSGYRTDTIVPQGSSPSVTPGVGYSEIIGCIDAGYEGVDLESKYRERYYSTEDEGVHKQVKNLWEQQLGCTYRTKLVVIAPDGTRREADISQLSDATHSMSVLTGSNYVGAGSSTVITGTESNFPVANNVWQIALFIKLGIVVVLRDLYADGADNNPTPHIETWDISGDVFAKLSTVRLGSYSETMLVDDSSEGWKAGDQEWNPYAFGAPRMKGCLDTGGNPQILVMVGESKKVTSSQSGFKRACYALISLANPAIPSVSRVALTSPDEGVGNSGDVPGHWPLWGEWDTLILTPEHVTWIRDSQFREAIV